MTRARRQQKKRSKNRLHSNSPNQTLPFITHITELRRRVFYVALSVGIFGAAAYGVEHHIVKLLLEPAQGQQFIYTSPGGGLDFLFRLCLYAGIICSIPVVIYQFLRYLQPLLQHESLRFITLGSIISGVLAIAGMWYGYFWGLPAALDFLLHQFVTPQIRPLVTIQSYMSFVMVYMVGSALLFQIPLVLIFINRIKPIKPQRLLKYERHVIVGAFIGAAIMNPTPNVLALLLLALPIILMYQVGIGVIWYTNRRVVPRHLSALRKQDAELRQARLQTAPRLQPLPENALAPETSSPVVQPARNVSISRPVQRKPIAPHRARPLVQEFLPRSTQANSRAATFSPLKPGEA